MLSQQQIRPGVQVIIINWNTRGLLEDCLNSLFKFVPAQLPPNFELLVTVVDNASADDSAAMVRRQFPQVQLIMNERNVGFAAANNQVLGQSNLSYLWLLNSDTIVLENSLKPLLDFMQEHPKAGVTGPRLLNADHSLQTSCRDFPGPYGDFINQLELMRWPTLYAKVLPNYAAQSEHTELRQVDWLTGASLLVRQESCAAVGPMDESYFFYAEEMDWCYRFGKVNWQIWFVPQAELIHLGGQSSQKVPYQRILWLYKGQLRFYHKHYSWLKLLGYKLGAEVVALGKILALVILLIVSNPQKRKHRIELLKTYGRVLWLVLKG